MQVNTHGKWMKYSEFQELEDGKSYSVKFDGDCLVALSDKKPITGMKVPSLDFTKEPKIELWIKTA